MKHVVNNRSTLVTEMIEGLVYAYDGAVTKVDGVNGIIRRDVEDGKVALVVGGGSGHEPIYHGLVGRNMADAAAVGNIFASPNPDIIYQTAKAAHRGNGILFLYGNYAGDNMNFDIAAEMLQDEGIDVQTVRVHDDVAVKEIEDRRGIAGLLFAVKIAGGVCSEASTLQEAFEVASQAVNRTRSIGVALQAGVMLNTSEPTFLLGDDEIEIGMGIHGEPGVTRTSLMPADELADAMMDAVLRDLPFKPGDEVSLLINDLGAMTNMELLIVNRRTAEILKNRGIVKLNTVIGKISTTQDMKGFSISLISLNDQLKRYLYMDADSFAFTWNGMNMKGAHR